MVRGYTIGNILQILTVTFMITGTILVYLASISVDYPAYKQRCNKIIANPGLVTDCENEAALGDVSCVDDFYKAQGWLTLPWWILYFTVAWMLVALIPILIYMITQRHGWTWWLMLPFLILGVVWLVFCIVYCTIYWVNCEDHTFCSKARYNFDFTGEVQKSTDPWWIVFNVGLYVLLLGHFGLFFMSIGTQACLSRAVHGRDSGLHALFTEEDYETVQASNPSVAAPVDAPTHQSPSGGMYAQLMSQKQE